jgi:uncharacterized membrane protein HdeD (DUF308 family)
MEAAMPVGLPADSATLRSHSTWYIAYSIIMILLGLFAIAAPMVATLAVGLTVGWLLLFGGVSGLFAVYSAGRSAPGFGWNLLIAIVYVLAGLSLVISPIAGVVTLTIILAAYLLAGGIARILMAFGYRSNVPTAWGWVLFSGLVDVLLAVIIISGMPGTAIWVLGLLVGVNLLMMGISILMVALAVRRTAT